jgi:hypothetical protein
MEKNNFFITYSGVVEFVGKTQDKTSKTGKPYQMRDLAVSINDANPEYPVTLVFQLLGDKKLPMANNLSKGMDVVVTFTINSKSYVNDQGETKYFLSLNLIKVEGGAMNQAPSNDTGFNQLSEADDGSDLPF